MPTFDSIYNYLGGAEGGYANVAGDNGGETYAGIARVYHPEWGGWSYIDDYKGLHGGIKNNTKFPALENLHYDFVVKEYWDKYKFADLKSSGVATMIFDFLWGGGGFSTALKVLSRMTGKTFSKWSNSTIAAINELDPKTFMDNLAKVRLDYYQAIVDKNPSQEKFLQGWKNRTKKLMNFVSGSAGTAADVVKKNPVKSGLILFGVLAVGLIVANGRK